MFIELLLIGSIFILLAFELFSRLFLKIRETILYYEAVGLNQIREAMCKLLQSTLINRAAFLFMEFLNLFLITTQK